MFRFSLRRLSSGRIGALPGIGGSLGARLLGIGGAGGANLGIARVSTSRLSARRLSSGRIGAGGADR